MNYSEWDNLNDAEEWHSQDGVAIPFSGFHGALEPGTSGDMDLTGTPQLRDRRSTPAFLTAAKPGHQGSSPPVKLPYPDQRSPRAEFLLPPNLRSDVEQHQQLQPLQQTASTVGSLGPDLAMFDPDPALFDAAQPWQHGGSANIAALPTLSALNLLPAPGPRSDGEIDKRSGSPEDAAFSEVLATVMHGQRSPAQALKAYAAICRRRARELRATAAGQLQRATHYVAIRDEAIALDEEAATWQLLWHLAGDKDAHYPGGWGGGEEATAATADSGRTSVHQQVAAIIATDDDINRAARVVAWLEDLAAEALDSEEALMRAGGGTAGRFGATEGVWAETQLRLAAGMSHQSGYQMVSELDPDAPGRQRRALHSENTADEERILSRLWRLIRAGRVAEAQALCRESGQSWRAASLAGGGRWGPTPVGSASAAFDAEGCANTDDEDEMAAQVADGDTLPRSLWRCSLLHTAEAAAASSDAGRRGPPASTLEAAIYGALAGDLAEVLPACRQWEDTVWALFRCWLEVAVDSFLNEGIEFEAEHMIGSDLLAAAVPGDTGAGIIQDVIAVQQGGWPLHRVASRLPQHFGAVFTDSEMAEAATVQAALKGHHRGLQAALILNEPQQVVDLLVARVLPAEGGKPAGSAGAMRFAAHFALALRATGFIDQPAWHANQYDPLQEAIGEVVQAYLVHAMSIRAVALVPQLACHLRAGRRHLTYAIFAEQLTARPTVESRLAFNEAADWFGCWDGGDVLPAEMPIIVNQIGDGSRASPAGGPAFRVQSARWLTFSDVTVHSALRHAVLLARDLALGLAAAEGPSADAAYALLHDVLPSGQPGVLMAHSPQTLSEMQLPEEVVSSLAEIRLWQEVFANERAFQELQQETAEGPPPIESIKELLASLTGFLTSGRFEALLSALQANDGQDAEMKLTAVPAALVRPATESEVRMLTAGEAYPVIAPEDGDEAVQLLQNALEGALASSPALDGLVASATRGKDASEGLLSVHLRASASTAEWPVVQAVAATAAAAIKSSLPGTEIGGGLQLWVITVDGSDACVMNAAWRIIAPRIALQAAELRQAAVTAGAEPEVGSQLVSVVAGVTQQAGQITDGLAHLFSSRELQEFLEWERSTALVAMHHAETAVQQKTVSEATTPATSGGFVML